MMMARMGGTVVMFSWFAVFALLTLRCLAATETRDFMMRPGQPEVVEVTAGGTTCKLEFACKGGTGEAWAMTLEETSDGAQCTIGRTKPPTYLIVHEFKATITNPKLVIDEVQLLDNNGKQVDPSTWKVNAGKGEVSPRENWGGVVTMMSLNAVKRPSKSRQPKAEL